MFTKVLCGVALLISSQTANSTVWIGGSSPNSKNMVMIGSSSGPIGNQLFSGRTYYSHFYNKGQSIVTFGSYGVFKEAQKEVLNILKEPMSAEDITREIYAHPAVHKKIRITALSTINSSADSLVGSGGCRTDNQYCGEKVGENYVIVGGGLDSDSVLVDPFELLTNPLNLRYNLVCKLYSSLKVAYSSGGEKEEFNNLVMLIDDENREDVIEILIKRKPVEDEKILLRKLKGSLAGYGYFCE